MSKTVSVRDIAPEEFVLVKELHAKMGIGYQFPDISSPLFAIRKGVFEEGGEITAAAGLKLTAEAFLWIDPEKPEFDKTSDILRLAHICHERAKGLSLEDVTAWVPPDYELMFANMLGRMGWNRSPWASWSVKI